jgi:hypothetical protein
MSCLRGRWAASMRTHGRVSADAPCFTPGNFKKDATVRPSHGRPRGHRPIVRSSVRSSKNVRVTTLPMTPPFFQHFRSFLFLIFGVWRWAKHLEERVYNTPIF